MDETYTKLSALVDSTFTLERVSEYQYKRWNNAERRFDISDSWQKDFKKVYTVDTNKGLLDLSASQLGQVLECISYKGEASLPGKTIEVKSNMTAEEFAKADKEEKMKIRYFFNPGKAAVTAEDDVPYGDEGGW